MEHGRPGERTERVAEYTNKNPWRNEIMPAASRGEGGRRGGTQNGRVRGSDKLGDCEPEYATNAEQDDEVYAQQDYHEDDQ
jgi:hypothetical protein